MSKQIMPIERLASVKLSLADWNSLLCFLVTAARHSEPFRDDIHAMQDKLRSQTEAKISAAFTAQFPETFGACVPER